MARSKIVVKYFSDPNFREYHVSKEISLSHEIFKRPLRPRSNEYLKRVGKVGAELVRDIIAVPGVASVGIESYHLWVSKGHAFEWAEIESYVVNALKQAVGTDVEVVEPTPFPYR